MAHIQTFFVSVFVCLCLHLQTEVPCVSAGQFSCPLVVTMRPVPAAMLDTVVEVTHLNPLAHGAPVHIGDPGAQTHAHTLKHC